MACRDRSQSWWDSVQHSCVDIERPSAARGLTQARGVHGLCSCCWSNKDLKLDVTRSPCRQSERSLLPAKTNNLIQQLLLILRIRCTISLPLSVQFERFRRAGQGGGRLDSLTALSHGPDTFAPDSLRIAQSHHANTFHWIWAMTAGRGLNKDSDPRGVFHRASQRRVVRSGFVFKSHYGDKSSIKLSSNIYFSTRVDSKQTNWSLLRRAHS